jgi:hypothetical protein
MSDTKIDSFPFGAGKYIPVDHTGPSSYAVTGDVIGTINNMTGITAVGLSTIDNVEGSGSYSVSGAFQVFAQPSGRGSRKTWILLWNSVGGVLTVVQNVAGSTMTPGTYPLTATGGGGTGFSGTVTVLTATTISAPIITSAGRGYTSAPTITAATGGTPVTFTVTVSAIGPVAAATNLSAEVVRLAYIGR